VAKVTINILQGSAVAQTVLGDYISSSCKFHIVYIYQKLYSRLAVDNLIAVINRLAFFWPTLYMHHCVHV